MAIVAGIVLLGVAVLLVRRTALRDSGSGADLGGPTL
jgi:hypothetical protein